MERSWSTCVDLLKWGAAVLRPYNGLRDSGVDTWTKNALTMELDGFRTCGVTCGLLGAAGCGLVLARGFAAEDLGDEFEGGGFVGGDLDLEGHDFGGDGILVFGEAFG
jgi:hypothetical protein